MENSRPRGREKNATGPGKSVQRRGAGLGTRPVGEAGGYQDRTPQSGGTRGPGSRGGGIRLIVLLLALLLGGGGGLTAFLGSQSGGQIQAPATGQQQPNQGAGSTGTDWTALLSGLGGGSVSSGWENPALKTANVKFDFIGFDACLMATAETALTLTRHADYLIASEETEPGVGWYYTDWLPPWARTPPRQP